MMDAIEKLKKIDQNIWFFLIFIFASLFYAYNLNFSDIWIDEAFTKALVRHSYGEIIQLIKNDFHTPLYFFGLKLFIIVFGLTNVAIRLFSVLGVLTTLVLVYRGGQKIFGKTESLFLCVLIVSLPMLAEYAHEARMYTWGSFAVTGTFSVCFSVSFVQQTNRFTLVYVVYIVRCLHALLCFVGYGLFSARLQRGDSLKSGYEMIECNC
jgi:uncharacterized membrane protein